MSDLVRKVASVAVIIPVYNRQTTVLKTLRSVIDQGCLPERLIVVDDGSTDRTVESVETLLREQASDLDWVVLQQSNMGASAARAKGMGALAEHPPNYVCFLDSDDCWPSDFIQRCASTLSEHADAVAVTIDRQYVCEEGFVPQRAGGAEIASNPIEWFIAHGAGVASATMVRYSAVINCGGWDKRLRYSEDTLFFSKLSMLGQWVYSPGEPVIFHLGNAAHCGEEANLSQIAPDRYLRWAVFAEKVYFILQAQNSRAAADKRVRAAVCRRWKMSGKQSRIAGDSQVEAISFARAFRWELTFKSFRKFVRAWIKCFFRPRTEAANRLFLPSLLCRREFPDFRAYGE